MRKTLLLASSFLAISLSAYANVDWQQESARGQDAAVSHDGNQWFIGADGKAYQWDGQNWKSSGGRSDFIRIDAGVAGAAAITKSGALYFNFGKGWQSSGIRADDVGIGGGQIWLAGARNKNGGQITLNGAFDGSTKINWQAVKGTLDRIDVDPEGRPWGIDNNGSVFVYADGTWIEDTKAPKASDIGAGGDGSLYIVGSDINKNLGGGRVYNRDPNSGEWQAQAGRLSAITVTPDGKAFGVNSLNWVMAGTAQSATPVDSSSLPDNTTFKAEGDKTLADILGSTVPGADKVKLSQVEITEDTIAGTAELNGSPVRALLHQPDPKDALLIAGLEHASIDLGTYIPKIRNTDLGSFGLANAVFYMQPENAEKIEYSTYEDMPAPLSKLLEKQKGFKDLFPLTLHPGITVIGTFDPNNKNAKAVLKAYGIEEAGYTVKGHFKLSQLNNLSFDIPNAPKRPSNKKEACESTSTAALSGLDLSFPIPNFKPAYTQEAIEFSNAKFTLKEIGGKIEPSIISGMNMKLPEKTIGIKNIPMVAKLAVRGDLNVLCNGINKQTEGVISFAASTVFNAEEISDVALKALSRVSDEGAESPEGEGLGWEKPFGLPFLNVRQYAVSGVFEQKEDNGELKRTLSTTTWSDSTIDRANIDVFGTVDYEIKPDTLEITDWSFELPGPVALNDLPGLKDMPKVDEFTLKDIFLTPSEMTGALQRQNKNIEATAYLEREENEFNLFVQFDNLTPSAIYDFIPKEASDITLAPALIAWSNKPTTELKYSDAPEKLQPLLKGLIEEDDALTIGKGFTLGGLTAPEKIFKGRLTNLLKDYIEVSGNIGLFGVFAKDENDKMNGELRGMLDTFRIKNIPESIITFKDSEIVLSNIEGSAVEIETAANMQAPGKNTLLDLNGTLTYEEPSENKNSLNIALTSDYLWNNPFKIPEFQISNLGFEAAFEKSGKTFSQNISLTGDGVLRKQNGEVSIDFESLNGDPEFAAVTFEGSLNVSELLSLPSGAEKIANATFNKIVLGTNAIGGDLAFNANGLEFDGRGAVIFDNDGAALFLNYDKELAIGKIIDDIPKPFSDISLPKGLVIISPRSIDSFDANYIPDAIYDDVLAGLIKEEEAHKLKVDDGLTFMTKINPSSFPTPIPAMLETPFGIKSTTSKGEPNEIYIAGSVGGVFGEGDPSLGFFTILQGVTPTLPGFIKEFIEFKDSNLKLFVQSKKGSASSVEVGIAADAKIKPRRLDDPTIVQHLDGTFALTYSAGSDGTSMTGSASVNGQWQDPMGLEGFSFQNPSIALGIEEKGITVGVHTDRADFSQSGTNKAFVFDLDTTWAGGVPTDLAVQFAKTKDTDELILTPVDMARVQKSVFDLAFRSGSKLKDAMLVALEKAPTFGDPALELVKNNAPDIINKFTALLENANNGMFSLIENSPLAMVGVKNPQLYFGTPGSTPPSNPDIERPPLGLGLHVDGTFNIDAGLVKANLANGTYKINLRDGYFVEGSVTPPAPFAANRITVAGNMPLFGGPQYLRFNGNLEVPGAEIAGISLGVKGNFDVTRGSMLEQKASVAADVSIGGLLKRKGTMALNGTSLSFNSPSKCTDVPPLDISGSLSLNGFTAESMTQSLLSSFKPTVPDPVECAGDIFEKFQDIAKGTVDVISDPLGNAENLGENLGDMLSNPGETLKNAGDLAQTPINAAEALGDAGISLVKMGLEKVPVLGPGAGEAIGAAYDQAKKLKDAAVNAVTNNAVTNFVGSTISDGYDAVTGVFKTSERTWYSINPLRCIAGERYWNQMFRQCFENGAVVLFDNTTRQGDSLGECMATAHLPNLRSILGYNTAPAFSKGALKVGACKGNGFNQFHLDSVTDQIRAVKKVYNGKRGDFIGPNENVCLTRRLKDMGSGLKKDDVYVHRCAYGASNQEWTYTADMKLKNGDQCIIRNSRNALTMGSCQNATPWLGTSVVPDWNLAKDVPIRGQITHVQSGRCLNWWDGGPHRLIKCGDAPGLDRDLRTHARIRVLDKDNTISIMGSAYWNTHVYPCVGLTGPNSNAVMNRHCWPAYVYEEAKWKVWPIINNKIDTTGQIPLIDVLTKYEYVFENVQNGHCLTASMTPEQIKDEGNRPWVNTVENCRDWWGNAKKGVRFVGYAADDVAQGVIDKAAEKARKAWEAAREKIRPIIYDWQQYRIRAENARISEVRKMASTFNSNIKSIQLKRKSPGHCKHGEYWNQTLKICAKDNRMLLKYHKSDGTERGCLQETSDYYGAKITQNCSTTNEHDAIIDAIAFFFDNEGRIIKKNADYWANVQKRGGEFYDIGNVEVAKDDTCLAPNLGVNKIDGLMPVDFGGCVDTAKWRYSPSGELVSHEGKCLRNYKHSETRYNRENVKKQDDLLKPIMAEINRRLRVPNEWRWNAYKADRLAFIRRKYAEGAGAIIWSNGVLKAEEKRLKDVHGITAIENQISKEQKAAKNKIEEQYPIYTKQQVENFVLLDCSEDPMEKGKYRWIPTVSVNFSASQKLPQTAKIKLKDSELCATGNLFINGDFKLENCSAENKNQYFAFGGTDQTRFLISSRNSKTCLFDAGQGDVLQRPCRGHGAELFMQINQDDGSIKLQNALSGQCLSSENNVIKQKPCGDADSFTLDIINNIDAIEFEAEGLLQPDEERTTQAQEIWNKAQKRAEYIYMGAYLKDGNALLQKAANDNAVINANHGTVTLEKLPSHASSNGIVYIPAKTVPKTQILTLPGFDGGAHTVTFAHARPVTFTDGKPARDHTANPYAANYADWFVWSHYQKVLRVLDNGTLKFEYIDESEPFRKSASFKMIKAEGENRYIFESISNPGKYLQNNNGALTLGQNQKAFTFESAAKWFKSEDIDFTNFAPPYRAPRPPFKNWKHPEEGWIFEQ